MVQIYLYKRSPETGKAERFFKERRLPYQLVDLKKHRLGARELQLFVDRLGVQALLATDNPKIKEHPISYTTDKTRMIDYLMESPELIRTPLIRNGQQVLAGYDEAVLKSWVADGDKAKQGARK